LPGLWQRQALRVDPEGPHYPANRDNTKTVRKDSSV
jgi:hypothetical protein